MARPEPIKLEAREAGYEVRRCAARRDAVRCGAIRCAHPAVDAAAEYLHNVRLAAATSLEGLLNYGGKHFPSSSGRLKW